MTLAFPFNNLYNLSTMNLHELLSEMEEIDRHDIPDLEIEHVTANSREVIPGGLFVAMLGTQVDGHRFFGDAAERGAIFFIGQEVDPGLAVPYIRVEDSRWVFAQIAAKWHGNPCRNLELVGVTGTDGKTTTASLIYEILRAAGLEAGLVTSVSARIADQEFETGFHVTTPDALALQDYLAQMVMHGLTHCVLEVTSHGLAQHRVSGCEFDHAVLTNISHEHLDYHQSFSAYREAKGRLFGSLSLSEQKRTDIRKSAVLNWDDDSFDYFSALTDVRKITYGLAGGAEVVAKEVVSAVEGLAFTIEGSGYSVPIRTRLLGEYNVYNILAAFSLAVEGMGIHEEIAASGISGFMGIPGRMEFIESGQPFTAIVDFAHTPNALQRALETVREVTDGKVIAVFGSAGLRDRQKRRMMAELSVQLADVTVLTAEDPRTESLDNILDDMSDGARSQGGEERKDFWRIPDRGEALRFATRMAEQGDLVIACGKGHEQSMCFGETEYLWDDRVALRAALAQLLEIEGPDMPELPTSVKA
jgi:UDP-N-acetylmuramoyl-L-alanyl-D-glutamate--2,6-diaminopimelate ligase